MLNQRLEMKLPDDTVLIAETTENSEYPGVSIYHKDTDGKIDEVAFAEYNPENQICRKLMAGIYNNSVDEPRYYKTFHYVFKPAFKELYQVYKETEKNEFKIVRDNAYLEIVRKSDGLIIYRDFSYDNDMLNCHVGDNIVLAAYGADDGIRNVSVECSDCNEVLYSVGRKISLQDIYKIRQPRSMFDVISFAKDSEKLQSYGCIGYSTILFGPSGEGFNAVWTDKTQLMRTEKFTEVYNELLNDYLSFNLLKNSRTMEKYCEESEDILKIWDGEYSAQIVSDDYTFFIRMLPSDSDPRAYIFAFANEIIYTQLEPLSIPASANVDCEAAISYVKHLDSYKNPKITYLDEVENECWRLFKQYAEFVGVQFGDGIDYSIAKEISEKIMSLVERTFGIDFPVRKEGAIDG